MKFRWRSMMVLLLVTIFLIACWSSHLRLQKNLVAATSSNSTVLFFSDGLETNLQTDQLIMAAAKDLAAAPDAAAKKHELGLLKRALASGSRSDISAAIRRLLDSKLDASTGEGFKVGRHGFLAEAPTLRTWLLDYLGQIDPVAAADYAKVILSSTDSPDEWAVALRNLAQGDTSANARALLVQKTTELLSNQSWQQNPSVGFLEAFDVAVYLGDSRLVPNLTSLLLLQNNPAVTHASFLALDRLVINDPATTLNALLADTGSMQGRQETRADYFARADVRDPQQRQILENYLLSPQIGAAEISAFGGIYPNANYMISDNLLTQNQTPDRTALASRDAASLQALQQWLADPRFAQIRPSLENAENRLEGFVQQENQQR